MELTRRTLIAGAVGGVGALTGAGLLVENEVLPGRDGADLVPDVPRGPLERGILDGAGWWLRRPGPSATPPGPTPVVLAFHPAFHTADSLLGLLGLDRFLTAAGASYAVAAIDGGRRGYWHPRDDGRDPLGLVLDRFLPMLEQAGLDVARPGLLGWSMGGYGAMVVATELASPGPVSVASPALWQSYGDSAPSAFDGRADFAQWGMFARSGQLDQENLRIDCGRGDPFYPAVRQFRDRVPRAEVHISRGGHDAAYWTQVLPGQLAWLEDRMRR
jgi:hypothetical protein